MTQKSDALKTYAMAREDAGRFMDRIDSLAQIVAVAARSPDAQTELNPEDVSIVCDVITEDLKQIKTILDQYHDQLR
ncbi:MAG: hypothetical protein AAF065_05500 [Verrucomicrobiota bacterium]